MPGGPRSSARGWRGRPSPTGESRCPSRRACCSGNARNERETGLTSVDRRVEEAGDGGADQGADGTTGEDVGDVVPVRGDAEVAGQPGGDAEDEDEGGAHPPPRRDLRHGEGEGHRRARVAGEEGEVVVVRQSQ